MEEKLVRSRTLFNEGQALLQASQWEEALSKYEAALLLYEEQGDRLHSDLCLFAIESVKNQFASNSDALLNIIEVIYLRQGQIDKALNFYQQILIIARKFGDILRVEATLNNLAVAYYGLGQYTKALECCQQLLPIQQQKGDRETIVQTLTAATNLVVLSACKTQKGKLSSGDEIVGMSRAFLYAGTPSVMASMWMTRQLDF